ncbi:MAG: hypothetical protein P4L64_11510 [Caulobacteraceae bacterium]|nr:hypothetical protein [Caulobacteraceae bacterium]
MSRLIKSAQGIAVQVRPLEAASAPKAAPSIPIAEQEALTAARELQALHQRLAALEAEVEQHRPALERARAEGEAQGRKAGHAEAEATEARRLAALERGLTGAAERYTASLADLERLAAALAKEGLRKIIGDTRHYDALLAASLRHHLAALDDQAILRVEVSASDFPATALDDLAAAIGRPKLILVTADDLASGDCRIRLILGTLELGLAQQAARLEAVLDALIGYEADR